jgi:amidohydrolase
MIRLVERVTAGARSIAPDAVRMRRDLHRHPEVSWSERRTTYRIAESLEHAGLTPVVRPDGVGLTVEVGSGRPIVGFRADIDALPIAEQTGAPYRSLVDGVMHACGHDAHAAIGAGIAGVLATLDDVPGTARIIFQPAEETLPSGAARLVEEGVHEGLSAVMAFHVDPTIRAGSVGLRVGPITSAADMIHLRVTGPGGHTSRPERTADLVRITASIVANLPERVRSEIDPDRHAAIVFGRVCGGKAANAIPTEIELSGTARVQDPELWRALPGIVKRAIESITAGSGAGVDLDYRRGSPPVDNDERVIETVRDATTALLGPGAAVATPQSMGSEDFSWFLQHVPGALIRLGVGGDGEPVDLHSPTFDLDEAAIRHGIAVGVLSLVRLMQRSW